MLRGGWDSGRGAGPAPSGKRRFWLRFGAFGVTSVVPPTEAPGGGNSSSPGGLPGAAQPPPRPLSGLPPGRPGPPPRPPRISPRPARISPSARISSRLHSFPDFTYSRAFRPLAQSQEYAIYIPWPLQIHHVLRGQEWHHLTPGLTPGLDCSHDLTIPNRKAWCWTYSQGAEERPDILSCARDLPSPVGRLHQGLFLGNCSLPTRWPG